MPTSRWHQDLEVAELIEHLNQPDKYGDWNSLTRAEVQAILKEVDRCRKDFIYAARNYFWITNKQRGDQLFSLWPGQELILQKILELKAKGQPQKLVCIKARQLGCSTLIEALIAWRTMFFSGVNALVVSYDREHTADVLFPIMQFILDRMPWWLQPKVSSRKADQGIFFENPDPSARSSDPGLNSRIYVKGANSTTGVGQGIRLAAVHASEFCDWPDDIAKEIIDEDMTNALVEDAGTFAILESTAKGANRYAHKMWRKCVDLAERAEWYPLFLPWFFEASRVRSVVVDWEPKQLEARMRERVVSEWVRCQNTTCLQYHTRHTKFDGDRSGGLCPTCGTGSLEPYTLTNEQLAWMEHRRENAAKDDDSAKRLKQEMTSTAEESFQLSGYSVFDDGSQSFANSTARDPIAYGDFDSTGRFHGQDFSKKDAKQILGYFPCFQEDCTKDHRLDDSPCLIWEWPEKSAQYCCGADIAEGLGGRSCYSVGCVIKYSTTGGKDFQVATWRSNTVGVLNFAEKLNYLGKTYNDAMLAPECNKYDIVIGALRFKYNYPNLYRWKHLDSMNIMSQKLGWWTNISSRPRLWQTFRSWLQQEMFIVRSHNLVHELKNFVKDEMDDISAGGDQDEFDDELFSCMIGLYCAHEGDYSDALGYNLPRQKMTLENAAYRIRCLSCNHEWPENEVDDKVINPTEFHPFLDVQKRVEQTGGMRCPQCGSRRIEIQRNALARTYTDADRYVDESTVQWSPDLEFTNTPLPYELL